MSQWITSLLKQIAARKVEALLALAVPSAVAAIELAQSWLVQFVPTPAEVWALRTTELALLAILAVALSFIHSRPKLKAMPFGVHKDIKTGTYFCSRCYLKDKKHYPLEVTANAWKCSVCGQWKENPENPVTPIQISSPWSKNT